ncbi:class I SAM-dependent methyltransferase [Alkalibacterium olivapovliticus]|uniref:16S rRNA (Guanine1207-N2)-methyltransferase n=1 Tax=Alkalibacterium olivapovliticus TaxID=99907 RepID=A0A2T0W6N8_9LACT|nr:class I SAM-dependent methyltransferase [Alkalibacterium olivapovliticus]PRY82380.1 16S rRNA (guanine1207-N2)-methyltransferase [Alkalibacterium olivapovliticus]
MTDHYFTSKPNAEKDEKEINATLKGNDLRFITDAGVFSKDRVDFGSQVMIESIEDSCFPNKRVLDVGCGYGPVGLSLGKANPTLDIDMIDVNERALELAKKNASLNGIDNVSIFVSSIYEQVKKEDYGVIISNPPIRAGKETVHKIIIDAKDHLVEGGILIIVIQRKQGAPSAKKVMEETYGNVVRIALDKGYWVLQSRKN